MAKKKQRIDHSQNPDDAGGSTALGNAFALAGFAAKREPLPATREGSSAPSTTGKLDWSQVPRVVVRIERKGRAGKTVTVVQGLAVLGVNLQASAKQLRQRLGCGGSVENDLLVLQGDQRDRAKKALIALGVRKVQQG